MFESDTCSIWNVVKGTSEGFMKLGYLTVEDIGKRRVYRITKKERLAHARLREMALRLNPVLELTAEPDA